MNKLKFLTAGESHGKALLGIIEGIPAGLSINNDYINLQLIPFDYYLQLNKHQKLHCS